MEDNHLIQAENFAVEDVASDSDEVNKLNFQIKIRNSGKIFDFWTTGSEFTINFAMVQIISC